MKTSEVIGLIVGIVGLGVAGVVAYKTFRGPQFPQNQQANPGYAVYQPAPGGTAGLQLPPANTQVQQTISDANAIGGAIIGGIGQVAGVINMFAGMFGGN